MLDKEQKNIHTHTILYVNQFCVEEDFCFSSHHRFSLHLSTAEIQIFEKEQEGHSNGFWEKTREVREEEEEWVVTCVRDVAKLP